MSIMCSVVWIKKRVIRYRTCCNHRQPFAPQLCTSANLSVRRRAIYSRSLVILFVYFTFFNYLLRYSRCKKLCYYHDSFLILLSTHSLLNLLLVTKKLLVWSVVYSIWFRNSAIIKKRAQGEEQKSRKRKKAKEKGKEEEATQKEIEKEERKVGRY